LADEKNEQKRLDDLFVNKAALWLARMLQNYWQDA
jgi:hypothetical protein